MTFRPPITNDQRERILELARAGVTRNKIAAEVGVGVGTVSRYANAAGLSFDRSRTRAATEAARIDNAAKRESLAIEILTQIAATTSALKESARPESPRDAEQRSRALASLSRAFGDTTRAAPLGDTRNDEIRDAIRGFIGSTTEHLRLMNTLRIYEAKHGPLAPDEIEAADPANDTYGQVEQE